MSIKAGTPYCDGIARGIDGYDATSHTALAGKSDKEGELTSFIVETTCLHDCIDALHTRDRESDTAVRERFVAASKSGEGMGEILTTHLYRTHHAVEVKDVLHSVMKIAVVLE